MVFSVGVIGAGAFGREFIPLFQHHPLVDEVRVADVFADRTIRAQQEFGIEKVFPSGDDLIASDVDAIAILTQRHLHAPIAIKALNAGKHVYCAVPAALTLDELKTLVETVQRTGLTYMMGETSYYQPSTIYCRRRFRAGAFGRFVYGEGAYYHDMSHGFYQAFQRSGGDQWKRVAGFPPMLYPTHSTSLIQSVTGARMTSVSCLGYRDQHSDGIFVEEGNNWQNPYSNQTALCRTSDGGMCRINEFRRTAGPRGDHGGVIGSIFGTEGVFEQSGFGSKWWQHGDPDISYEDLNAQLTCDRYWISTNEWLERQAAGALAEFYSGKAPVQPTHLLPAEFKGMLDGHMGSHQFLVHDFCRAVESGRLCPNNVWDAARYNAPGIVALESARREGEMLPIPDFGEPPAGATFVDELI